MMAINMIAILKKYGIDLQSFLLLKAGVKPVIRICLDELFFNEKKLKELNIFCKQFGVELYLVRLSEMFGSKLEKPLMVLYLSLSRALAERAYSADKIGDRILLGKLLGYPECCIRAFMTNLSNFAETDHIRATLERTKTKPSLYCNNIYNFDSKLSSGSVFETFAMNYQIFGQLEPFFLIRHVPCSFDCPKSIELGEKTSKLLFKENKILHKNIFSALGRIILYFDYFNWLVFDGKISGDTLVYNKILPYQSLISKNIVKEFMYGNRLNWGDNNIVIFKNNELKSDISKFLPQGGIVIDFS